MGKKKSVFNLLFSENDTVNNIIYQFIYFGPWIEELKQFFESETPLDLIYGGWTQQSLSSRTDLHYRQDQDLKRCCALLQHVVKLTGGFDMVYEDGRPYWRIKKYEEFQYYAEGSKNFDRSFCAKYEKKAHGLLNKNQPACLHAYPKEEAYDEDSEKEYALRVAQKEGVQFILSETCNWRNDKDIYFAVSSKRNPTDEGKKYTASIPGNCCPYFYSAEGAALFIAKSEYGINEVKRRNWNKDLPDMIEGISLHKSSNNKTGYFGVYYTPVCKDRPYQAQCVINGVKKNLGYYKNVIDAAVAIAKAKIKEKEDKTN